MANEFITFEGFLKSRKNIKLLLIIGSIFNAAFYGSLIGILIFIFSFYFEAFEPWLRLFVSMAIGYFVAFILMYFVALMEFSDDLKKAPHE